LNEIEIGKVFKSRVVNVVDFGVFVDLEGVDGLVHKSELDWERIYNPSKLFKVGDEIEVKVVGVDIEKERVSLSRKAMLPNPWQKLADKYSIGDLVEGTVVSVLDFGAFVELQEGLQGLVHISEIGYSNTEDKTGIVQKGDKVLVRIMSIDPKRERVSLSMRRVPVSEQMEWMMNLEDAEDSLIQEGLDQAPVEETLEDDHESELDESGPEKVLEQDTTEVIESSDPPPDLVDEPLEDLEESSESDEEEDPGSIQEDESEEMDNDLDAADSDQDGSVDE
jgi:small subunit ribosomal protein S1